jgi:hypothetical protein
MAKSNKSLVSLATGKNKASANDIEVVDKVTTPEEERKLKAKETVDKLLENVDLSLEKKDDLLELATSETRQEVEGAEWLQEQVALLSSENELLKNDLAAAKDNYVKIFSEFQNLKGGTAGVQDDGVTKSQVIKLFNELQSNHLAMGKNQMTGEPNFRIHPIAFMNRLILFFPFLDKEKRF